MVQQDKSLVTVLLDDMIAKFGEGARLIKVWRGPNYNSPFDRREVGWQEYEAAGKIKTVGEIQPLQDSVDSANAVTAAYLQSINREDVDGVIAYYDLYGQGVYKAIEENAMFNGTEGAALPMGSVDIDQVDVTNMQNRPDLWAAAGTTDWTMNGDILFWNELLDCAFELSSMGIRVDPESLDRQLTISGCDDRRALTYHKMLLAGPSKAGKSFALIELCIAIAEGRPWLGRFSCAQGKVLYINLELDRASCLHRFKDVYTALGLPPQNLRNIDIWNLRGASVPMDKLAPKLIRRAQKKGYTAVILDPIYKVITGDENSADQMAKFCNQFDLVCRALNCAVIYCHHHSKGAQGGKRSMDRASGSGVFARDPDAMLDMTELTPTDAIREQLHNKAACRVIKAMLDKRGHADAYGLDDTLSRHRMLTIAKEKLGLADLRAIDAEVAAAEKKADGMTAWRIEGTLREFARFDPVNLWFDYPVHKPDTGLLEDLQPDSDFKTLGSRGASKRWGDKVKVTKDKKAELDTAFEACMMDGEVTVYALAEYMDLKPRTIKTRLKDDGRFWIDGEKVGRKEPGSAG